MSELFLRTPGFEMGSPRGLFQAALGISSALEAVGVDPQKQAIIANNNRNCCFIDPPWARSTGGTLRRQLFVFLSLPILIEADIVGRQIRQNRSPQLQEIHSAQALI